VVREEQSGSRKHMVAGAADMISRRGLNATSVRELAKHTGAPLGSTYHYFPGGKYDLATEAVRFADDLTSKVLARELQAGPVQGLRGFLGMWRTLVVDSQFQAGCPVLAVAVEEIPPEQTAPREAAAAAFSSWAELLAASFREHGASAREAQRVAVLVVAAVEGTVAICRAQRSTEALDQVSGTLIGIVSDLIKPQRKPHTQ
jgi:AcrR family transcriptional regulator